MGILRYNILPVFREIFRTILELYGLSFFLSVEGGFWFGGDTKWLVKIWDQLSYCGLLLQVILQLLESW